MQLIPNARRAWRLNTVQAATLLVVLSLVQTQFFPLLQLQVPAEVWPWVTAAFGLVIGLLRLRLFLVMALVSMGVGGLLGLRHTWIEQGRAEVTAQAQDDYREAVRLGNVAATAAQAEARSAHDFTQRLLTEKRHGPLVVAASGCAGDGVAADGGGVAGDRALGAAGVEPLGERHGARGPAEGGGDPELVADAVRVWNSALAGRPVPAGACGADDQAAGACAAGSGATVGDAWTNHIVNAGRWAEDRSRCERLIDYLEARGR